MRRRAEDEVERGRKTSFIHSLSFPKKRARSTPRWRSLARPHLLGSRDAEETPPQTQCLPLTTSAGPAGRRSRALRPSRRRLASRRRRRMGVRPLRPACASSPLPGLRHPPRQQQKMLRTPTRHGSKVIDEQRERKRPKKGERERALAIGS